MRIQHHAKINVCLYVNGKREDGYHTIETIMQEIKLQDTLSIEESNENLLECTVQGVPLGEDNLIWKAYRALAKDFDLPPVHCVLEKNIPVAAGLGGGSANAAAMLTGLNELFSLGLDASELEAYGATLGADVPYFIRGGTVYATGIGTELHTIAPYQGKWIVLVNDGTAISSKEVYECGPTQTQSEITTLLKELEEGKTALSVHNDLYRPVLTLYPHIESIVNELKDTDADTVLLSGSGATVFALYENEEKARKAAQTLDYPFVYVTQTV